MNRSDAWMIAWSYLERTGQIPDSYEATQRLSSIFGRLSKGGVTKPLLLANKAISEYERENFLFQEAG
jgi:hypothetical protein